MNPLAAQGFRCPVCGRGLELCPGRLACSRGHSFDLAREGYANLLPVQKKHARQPGDSGIVKTQFGYHIMYFCGSQLLWESQAKSDLISQMSGDFLNDAVAAADAKIDYSAIKLGFVDMA